MVGRLLQPANPARTSSNLHVAIITLIHVPCFDVQTAPESSNRRVEVIG